MVNEEEAPWDLLAVIASGETEEKEAGIRLVHVGPKNGADLLEMNKGC